MNIRDNYLERDQCDSIKGICILFVFASHFMQYVTQAGGLAIPIARVFGQTMVAPFLFYSGYGVMEQIKRKGVVYVRSMPKRRILTTLINFDVAVLLFAVLNMVLGHHQTLSQVLLSLTCWDSIGNSNWYIFVIILCYAIACISYLCARRFAAEVALALCLVSMFALSFVRPQWWYDTILCFPVGMIYSQRKDLVEQICQRLFPFVFPLFVAVGILLLYRCPTIRGLGLNVKAITLVLAMVMFTMKVSVANTMLQWFGRHLFAIYIYQRIPMIIFSTLHPAAFQDWRWCFYFILSFMVTVLIAAVYPKFAIHFTHD